MPMYYRNAHTVILVYDIQCHQSFQNLNKYLNILYSNCEEMPFVVLLGNKRDLKSRREVHEVDIKELSEDYDVIQTCMFDEVSAKTGPNFDKLLDIISSNLLFRNIPLNQKLKIKERRGKPKKIKKWFMCGAKYTS